MDKDLAGKTGYPDAIVVVYILALVKRLQRPVVHCKCMVHIESTQVKMKLIKRKKTTNTNAFKFSTKQSPFNIGVKKGTFYVSGFPAHRDKLRGGMHMLPTLQMEHCISQTKTRKLSSFALHPHRTPQNNYLMMMIIKYCEKPLTEMAALLP